MISKDKIFSCLDSLSFVFGCLALLFLLLGHFWWPGATSSWAASIRVVLLLALISAVIRIRHLTLSWGWIVFLLFWGYLFANACWVAESMQMERRLLLILVFVYVVSIPLSSYQTSRKLLAAAALAGGICAAFSLGSSLLHGQLSVTYRDFAITGSGIDGFAEFGNPIVAGLNYSFCLIFSVWLALTANRKCYAIFWGICALSVAVYIYFTYARTGWIASLVAVGILLALLGTAQVRKVALLISFFLIVAILVFCNEIVYYELTQRSLTGRDEIWVSVLSQLSGNWITGYGAGVSIEPIIISNGTETVHNTHGLYLEVLFQFGLVGLVLMIILFASCVVTLFRSRAEMLAPLWLSMLIGISFSMLVDMHSFVSTPNLVWIYFWLPVAGCLAISRGNKHAGA